MHVTLLLSSLDVAKLVARDLVFQACLRDAKQTVTFNLSLFNRLQEVNVSVFENEVDACLIDHKIKKASTQIELV